jgi:hypothetical protein
MTDRHQSPDALYLFDSRGVVKRFRHATVFGALIVIDFIRQ